MLANAFDFGEAGQAGLDLLAELVQGHPAFELTFSRLDEAIAAVETAVGLPAPS